MKLTMEKLEPEVRVNRCLPPATFESECALYEGKRIPFVEHLVGELDRIESYPARGWIASDPLPIEIVNARQLLRKKF